MRAFYFGCYGAPGHRFFEPGMRSVRAEQLIPWGYGIDGALAPRKGSGRRTREQPEGVAALHHRDRWTALAFWDRTGDHRGASNSVFLLERGDATFNEMVAMARDRFPQIIERLTFPIVDVECATAPSTELS